MKKEIRYKFILRNFSEQKFIKLFVLKETTPFVIYLGDQVFYRSFRNNLSVITLCFSFLPVELEKFNLIEFTNLFSRTTYIHERNYTVHYNQIFDYSRDVEKMNEYYYLIMSRNYLESIDEYPEFAIVFTSNKYIIESYSYFDFLRKRKMNLPFGYNISSNKF